MINTTKWIKSQITISASYNDSITITEKESKFYHKKQAFITVEEIEEPK